MGQGVQIRGSSLHWFVSILYALIIPKLGGGGGGERTHYANRRLSTIPLWGLESSCFHLPCRCSSCIEGGAAHGVSATMHNT